MAGPLHLGSTGWEGISNKKPEASEIPSEIMCMYRFSEIGLL